MIRRSQPGAERLAEELETGLDGRFVAGVPLPAGEYRVEIRKAHYASERIPIRLPAAGPPAVSLLRYGSERGYGTGMASRYREPRWW